MKNVKYKIILVLFLIALASSIVLSIIPKTDNTFCDINEEGNGGCNSVYNSPYNYTMGIRNCHWGILIFSALSLTAYLQMKKPSKQKRDLIHTAVIIGAFVSIYFIYLQKFVIHAYCKYCMVVDISLILALGIIIWKWKE